MINLSNLVRLSVIKKTKILEINYPVTINISNIFPHYSLSMWTSFINDIPNFKIGFDTIDKRDIHLVNSKKEFSLKEQKHFFLVKNIYFLNKHLVYQFFVIPRILFSSYNVAIFIGDSKVISTWISLIICKIRNKESILWTHGIYGNESKFKLILRKIFYGLARKLIVYERKGKDGLVNYGFEKNKIHVIFNSLNYKFQLKILNKLIEEKPKTEFFKKNDLPYIISTGRLNKRKKIDQLINIICELNNTDLRCNLLIVGEGNQKNFLEKLSKKCDDRIHFFGSCYDEELLGQLIYNASICVIPGDIGLSAIHSLTYGTPVITHNNFKLQGPEHEAIEQGLSGDFYEFQNYDDLKLKIKNWLEKKRDKKLDIINCRKNIDKYYNPNYQVKVMKKIIEGGEPLI